VAAVVAAAALTACSGGAASYPIVDKSSGTPSFAVSPSVTAHTPSGGPSATAVPTATARPTTASASPGGGVKGLAFGVSSTVPRRSQQVLTTVAGDRSLAGKQVVLVDLMAPDVYKIFSKLTLSADGTASGYLRLAATDKIIAYVPVTPVTTSNWNPDSPVLAQSAPVTITVQ
jgi:hypothetical protein